MVPEVVRNLIFRAKNKSADVFCKIWTFEIDINKCHKGTYGSYGITAQRGGITLLINYFASRSVNKQTTC